MARRSIDNVYIKSNLPEFEWDATGEGAAMMKAWEKYWKETADERERDRKHREEMMKLLNLKRKEGQ